MEEIKDEKEKPQKPEVKNGKKKQKNAWVWPLQVFVLTFSLSLCMGILSEMALSNAGIVIAVTIIIVIISIGLIFDMIGVAVLSCDPAPFLSMASRKIRGSKEALILIRNASKVAAVCCDIIGDMCGILSGSAGAAIMVKLAISSNSGSILIATVIAASIAALTVFVKALGKNVAMNKSFNILHGVGKFLAVFKRKQK